ncbi:hypothetical protein NDU88_001217 [Pleurodeles waltl]|uniref:Uncharacterized protein n=1 Tax=Pleurodeles waltl TaxID=8319 RepID=A0AAV7KPT1_PLEWA|nr:hypothetical protein NDU88_001217 [Pleurodeles waltl]
MSPVKSAYTFMLCSTGPCVGRGTPFGTPCGQHLDLSGPLLLGCTPILLDPSSRVSAWQGPCGVVPRVPNAHSSVTALGSLPYQRRRLRAVPIRRGPAALPRGPVVGCKAESAAAELSGLRHRGSVIPRGSNAHNSVTAPYLIKGSAAEPPGSADPRQPSRSSLWACRWL